MLFVDKVIKNIIDDVNYKNVVNIPKRNTDLYSSALVQIKDFIFEIKYFLDSKSIMTVCMSYQGNIPEKYQVNELGWEKYTFLVNKIDILKD